MDPSQFSNADFSNLHQSVTNLDHALEDADRQKTAPKGARKPPEHRPLKELEAIVEEDLSKVINSPLRTVRGPGYGCLPLHTIGPFRRLYELLYRVAGPGSDPALLDDADTAADLHGRVQAFVASVDPDHPFLKVDFESYGDGGGDDGGEDGGEKQQQEQQISSAKGKGKQVAGDEQPK